MTTIHDSIVRVKTRIQEACLAANRPVNAVRLLAVSKTVPVEAIRAAHASGLTAFGENYVQEGVEKIQALRDLAIEWHCIGPLQSNKTRLVAEHFDWVHTVDRLKIAQRLHEQRPLSKPPLQVCVQVNVDQGPNKSGVTPEALPELAHQVAKLTRLRLRGLMCIPEPTEDFMSSVREFTKVWQLFNQLQAAGLPLDTLSMGMSGDLDAAVQSGSTLVRVGTAIFGQRA